MVITARVINIRPFAIVLVLEKNAILSINVNGTKNSIAINAKYIP
jgi:hypothetical protein